MGPFSHYHYHISDHTHVGNIKGVCHIWYDVDRHMDPSTKLHRISRFSKMKSLPSRLVRQRWPLSLIFKVWLMPDYFFYICYQSLLMKLDCKGKGSQ